MVKSHVQFAEKLIRWKALAKIHERVDINDLSYIPPYPELVCSGTISGVSKWDCRGRIS